IVKTTGGIASGPLTFMSVFNSATEAVKQGGRRRGANMGMLRVDHPDILDFIIAKEKEGIFNNFNLSVALTEDFMKAVENNKEYKLINPRTEEIVKEINAKTVFDMIVAMAWKNGEPGIVFLDRINKDNPTPHLGEIESTNPCGEQPLLPYESCNLGSINLAKMVEYGEIDWYKLRGIVHNAVHFLDNVIDLNKYPIDEIEEMTKINRKIGLGVMGFADMLIQLGIPYDSEKAIKTAEKVMKFISKEAKKASIELAKERRAFPNFRKSIYKKKIRNATITTIAPTGTISIIAGCSSGIEPLFAISFVRNVMEGTQLLEVNPLFEKIAKEKGFYSTELMMKIAKKGSIKNIKEIPKNIRKLFVTAHDISPEYHVKIQAAFQKYTDNAVSKTVNLPHTATIDEVKKVFLLAYKLKCKGVTVYRYGSKKEQVLNIGEVTGDEYVSADAEYAGGCPTPYCPWS
ncbi:MAG: adenosylcobalamin-dependent ribonucleoside-diphosphate reductase, partial [Methanosarcinales archaeon]